MYSAAWYALNALRACPLYMYYLIVLQTTLHKSEII